MKVYELMKELNYCVAGSEVGIRVTLPAKEALKDAEMIDGVLNLHITLVPEEICDIEGTCIIYAKEEI